MLYYLLFQLLFKTYGGETPSLFVRGLNVFQYVTFRTGLATITALLVSLLLGGRVIRKLREMKYGQEIREEGLESHQEKKGKPTMGGVLIDGVGVITMLLWDRVT